jgi:hypothetical protein
MAKIPKHGKSEPEMRVVISKRYDKIINFTLFSLPPLAGFLGFRLRSILFIRAVLTTKKHPMGAESTH